MDTREVARIRAAITKDGKGPTDAHVLISRAMHIVALTTSEEVLEAAIEALYEELYDGGLLADPLGRTA